MGLQADQGAAGDIDRPAVAAVRAEAGEARLRIDQMRHHEAVAGADRVDQRMLGLGQHLVPPGRSGPGEVLEIQAHQAAAFGVEIGAQEQRVAVDPDQSEFRQRLVDDLDRLTESAACLDHR